MSFSVLFYQGRAISLNRVGRDADFDQYKKRTDAISGCTAYLLPRDLDLLKEKEGIEELLRVHATLAAGEVGADIAKVMQQADEKKRKIELSKEFPQ